MPIHLLKRSRNWLLPLLLSAAVPIAAEEPLPVTVFKKLHEGKKQTVVVYGTSLTINGAWAKALGDYFAKEFPGQVTYLNRAQAGMHSKWGVANLKQRVQDHRPDLVFIEFSANDAATKHGISREQSEANLDQMVKALRQQNPQVDIVLQTMNPAWDSPSNPAKKYATDRPELESYYDVYRSYARANQLPLVDHYPAWRKLQQDSPEEFQKAVSDGIHPNSGPSLSVTWPAVHVLMEKARAASGAKKAGITANVWPDGKMPGHGAKDPEARHSPERTDALRITNVSQPTLDIFPAPAKDSPAMIVCPGGGYSYAVMDKEGTEIAAWLNANGFTALLLKYRVPNNRDGALQDLQRALSLARSRAAEWHIDPQRLGVIGFSAGGHLSARASNRFDELTYPAIDDVDQQSCRPDFAVLVYPAYLDDGKGGLSPNLNPKADIPPTLIVHSDDDAKFVVGSKLYDAALTEAKRPHKLLLYPTGGHGYGLRSDREAKAWPDAALQWLGEIRVK
ncbi:GDSL-type esterase/lipase family protein [Luteolibacter arcticus]|uniref:GDSL-type esterase/lipase family protein n=1 Tax=Luteolibacter arcticus TaxID=1581411 RepID=A0ABT3GNA6_9BACT|nr:GDSL-type esterase/lipase family protein [Luteolibacter arcticus]MCW1924977.1 GDSL-type esterase/lipase family protein [Luteolibacter arcticus]